MPNLLEKNNDIWTGIVPSFIAFLLINSFCYTHHFLICLFISHFRISATVYRKTKPGFRFTEKMAGNLIIDGEKHRLAFKLTIESKDIYHMLVVDTSHSAGIHGNVTCEALSKDPLTVSDGVFEMFSESEEKVETKEMIYKMTLTDQEGQVFHFRGEKCIHKNRLVSFGVTDTTNMIFTVHKGEELFGEGKLKLSLRDFMRQLTTIEVTNCTTKKEKLRWKAKFCTFFAGSLWEVYGLFSPSTSPFNPEAPTRERRQLKMNEDDLDIMRLTSSDGLPLLLTRYRGGIKGPILLLHGLGVSSRIFALDTVTTNLVEYLIEKGYDVWSLDMRFSIALESHKNKCTVIDAAEHDIPVAIDHILETTEAVSIQVFAHCVGVLAMFGALFAGYVSKDKVKSLVASQLGFVIKPTSSSSTRPNLIGDGVDAYTDTNENWMGRVFNVVSDRYASWATAAKEHCDSDVCHRVTFLYCPSWHHSNLNKNTHDTLHEWNGFTNKHLFNHLAKCASKKVLCNREGNKPIIPDWDSKNYQESAGYKAVMSNVDIPILFFMGDDNARWEKKSIERSYERCLQANPSQHYKCIMMPKYNHLDPIVGKNADTEVFPKFLSFLDKYSTLEQKTLDTAL